MRHYKLGLKIVELAKITCFQKFEKICPYDLTLARRLKNKSITQKKSFFKVSKWLDSQSYRVKCNDRQLFSEIFR